MKVGEIQILTVARVSDYGLYLADEEQNEVLLPNRYVSLTQKVGDTVSVFVYHDSEDRLVATTETPKIKAGEVACLEVVDKNIHGAFLAWGVSGKDLFMPNRNQHGGIVVGKSYTVYMYVDNITGRCVATNKLKTYVNNDDIVTVAPRQEVEILIASESPIGYRVIVENRHWGMLYKNQLFRPVQIGEKCRAYVVRVTDDNRIDLSLQRQGYEQVKDSADKLYETIERNGGFVPLTDNSSPEQVQSMLQMSKKLFKRSLGVLLSHKRVAVDETGIKILK
ncbi:MAG: S1 RNA-binding domain-containing protein [Alistipes sp.]